MLLTDHKKQRQQKQPYYRLLPKALGTIERVTITMSDGKNILKKKSNCLCKQGRIRCKHLSTQTITTENKRVKKKGN